jgi:hypothetical protein
MPETNCIAKKDFLPFFKKGDKITIVPILYEKDTCIVNAIHCEVKDEKIIRLVTLMEMLKSPDSKFQKLSDPVYAPKGSYKDSVIKLEDGRTYPSSLVRRYENYFEKVK